MVHSKKTGSNKRLSKHRLFAFLIASAALLTTFGCQSSPIKSNYNPAVVNPAASTYLPPVEKRYAGSLWTANRRLRLYDDLRARDVGDIVTVSIVENSNANKEAQTQSDSERTMGIKLDALFGGKFTGSGFGSGSDANLSPQAALDTSFKNEFQGTGKTDRKDSMSASIACRVVKVMPSGNLYIKGSRLIQVNFEEQYITLEGVIRPTDISPKNMVLSTHVAEARISYSGTGPVTDKQRPGWLARIFDFIWPF